VSSDLHQRIGVALDLWLDVERQADDLLDELLDDWVQITRTAMLSARDRLDQLEREQRLDELEHDLAGLEHDELGEEAPA
jgi:hypothetical protein